MRTPALALLALLLPLPALADTFTYTYSGNPFTHVSGAYTTTESITGQFTLASPLPASLGADTAITPLAFYFDDGVQFIDNTTSTLASDSFLVQTDAAGNITQWNIYITFSTPAGGSSLRIEDELAATLNPYAVDQASFAEFLSDFTYHADIGTTYVPGAFYSPRIAATPEPASIMLLLTGLAGTGAILRRTRIPLPQQLARP